MQQYDNLNTYSARTFMFNIISFIFSLGFLMYTTITVIRLRSGWYAFLVIYYSILLVMRFVILNFAYKNIKFPYHDKYAFYLKLYAIYGIIFILLTLFFASTFLVVDFKIYNNYRLTMPLIIFAGYAVVKFVVAIVNFIRAHKTQIILARILRNLSLIDALMTLGIMQTLIATYILGTDSNAVQIHHIVEVCIGIFMAIVVSILGSIMLIEASKKSKQLKEKLQKQNTVPYMDISKK